MEKGGSPIYAKHFVEVEIVSQTKRSWIIDYGGWGRGLKYPKKDPKGLYTYEQMQDKIWAHHHRYRIERMVRGCSVEQLKDIAKILGYKEEE